MDGLTERDLDMERDRDRVREEALELLGSASDVDDAFVDEDEGDIMDRDEAVDALDRLRPL